MDNNSGGAFIEMPKYECHKTVHALKIREVTEVPSGGAILIPEDTRYAGIDVDAEWVSKHSPEAGGYYVSYDDGYKSYSPCRQWRRSQLASKSVSYSRKIRAKERY